MRCFGCGATIPEGKGVLFGEDGDKMCDESCVKSFYNGLSEIFKLSDDEFDRYMRDGVLPDGHNKYA